MKVVDRLRYDRTLDTEKRIETGSYYTPVKLAEFMVCLSLAQLLVSRHSEMRFSQVLTLLYKNLRIDEKSEEEHGDFNKNQPTKETLIAIGNTLKSLRVLDLCAGSGVFPLAYFKVLSSFFINNELEREETLKDFVLGVSKNVFVVDIQEEPLQLYISELTQLYGLPSKKVNAFCIDALSDAQVEAQADLKKAFDKGFDLVLGNPPYLGEKHHKEIFQSLRQTDFGAKYYEGRMDYFYFFIYRALETLKENGHLCMITTNYFATADGAKHLRQFLKEHTQWQAIINFNDCQMFKDALGQHNMIFSLTKSTHINDYQLCYPKGKEVSLESLYQTLIQQKASEEWDYEVHEGAQVFDSQGMLKILPSLAHKMVLDKLQYHKGVPRNTLGDKFHVQQGIVSGFDRDFKANQGVFVLTAEEAKKRPDLNHYLRPFYKNSQVRKYAVVQPTQYEILYVSEAVDENTEWARSLIRHLKPHYERLALRREVIKGIRPWYALQWPREAWRFTGPLIAAPQRAFVNVFAYEEGQLHGSADLYYISDKAVDELRQERTLFMTAYLNSPIIYYWLALKGKRKGSMLELYATPLKGIPILDYNPEEILHQKIVCLTQSVMSALKEGVVFETIKEEVVAQINDLFYGLFDFDESEVATIEDFYHSMGAALAEENYWYTK